MDVFLNELGVKQNSLASEIKRHPTSVHHWLYPKRRRSPESRSKIRVALVRTLIAHLTAYREKPPANPSSAKFDMLDF
jgi:hypothetical protein